MSTADLTFAAIGLLIILMTIWQVAKLGIPQDNGNVDGVNSHDHAGGPP